MSELYQCQQLVAEDEVSFGTYAPQGLQWLLLKLARVPPFYRGAFRVPVSSLVRSLANKGVIDVQRYGGCFRIRNSKNLIENGLLIHPNYNKIEIDFLLDGTPVGGTFIDLGANVGLYTLPLAIKAGPKGKVLAIDANPDIVSVLAFNLHASGIENVEIANVAVSDCETKARLEIRKDDLAIVEVEEAPDGNIYTRTMIDVVNEAGLTEVHTLKADIEGFEEKAILPYLEQCSEALKPNRIVIEHLGRAGSGADCYPDFAKHGYKFVGKTRGNSLYERSD